jgi:hypothetical protein
LKPTIDYVLSSFLDGGVNLDGGGEKQPTKAISLDGYPVFSCAVASNEIFGGSIIRAGGNGSGKNGKSDFMGNPVHILSSF